MLEILFIVVLVILFNIPKWKFDNYTPPTGQKIDYNAQALDRVRNHLSNEQVMTKSKIKLNMEYIDKAIRK